MFEYTFCFANTKAFWGNKFRRKLTPIYNQQLFEEKKSWKIHKNKIKLCPIKLLKFHKCMKFSLWILKLWNNS